MKTKIEVQFMNKDVNVSDIEKLVKEDIKANGIKLNTLETLEVYYKPEQRMHMKHIVQRIIQEYLLKE